MSIRSAHVVWFFAGIALLVSQEAKAQPVKNLRLWSNSVVPVVADGGDVGGSELGLRFRSQAAGSVTGVAFYKSAANTGTHTGSLWSATGALLANVTFTNETASGWQTATFPAPVAITANTTYVISYHTDSGHFSADSDYFLATNGGVSSGPLLALATNVDGRNGVYKDGTTGFPNLTYLERNYWVDPIVTYPDNGATTAAPGSVVLETGTLNSGTAAGLATDENTFYRLNSTRSGTRTSSWYGSFTGVPNETPKLAVTYKGKNSRSCTEAVAIYNWTTAAWVALNSQAVTTTEVLRYSLTPAGSMADFVSGASGAGEVRVRVSCTTTANFTTSADLLSLTWDAAVPRMTFTYPVPGSNLVGASFTATYVTAGDLAAAGVHHAHLYLDARSVAMDIPMDLAYTFNSVPGGSHSLRGILARADHSEIAGTDAAAFSFTSSMPDVTPPSVSLTAPADGATVSGTTLATANAADDFGVAGVQFLLDGGNLGTEDTTAPYSVSFNANTLSPGTHALTARARDLSGNTTLSIGHSLVVPAPDTTFPTISMTAPADGATLSGNGITASADAQDNLAVVGVQFLIDGNNLGVEDATSPYAVTFNTSSYPPGAHVLTARARDAAGNSTVAAALNVTFTLPPDTEFPTISMTAPAEGATVSGASIAASADAQDNVAVVGVQFLIDGANLGAEDTGAPFSVSFNSSSYSPGAHVLTARARDAAGNSTVSAPRNIVISAGDTNAPTISLTAPGAGATIWGTISATADAADNLAVTGVQFLMDGANLGAEDTTAPYSVSFNANSFTAGTHQLTARARDAAGNTTVSAARSVSIVSATSTAAIGQWSGVTNWPSVGVHTQLMSNGKVLVFEGPGLDSQGLDGGVWDPATGVFTQISDPDTDLFCAATAALADGRILVVGGHGHDGFIGVADVNIFNPLTNTWTPGPPMHYRRWYPTATTLPDGRVLVTSGADVGGYDYITVPEIYNPVTNTWTVLSAAVKAVPTYPHMFVLANGKIAYTSNDEDPSGSFILDIATQTWTTVDPTVLPGQSAVMYEPGKFMKAGTSADGPNNPYTIGKTTYVIDYNSPTPAWQRTADMAFPRTFNGLTLLPDGEVLTANGSQQELSGTPVREAELWSPLTKTWRTLGRSGVNRMYHSNMLLMPDARVLISGSGRLPGMVDQRNYELYSPPYLFRGTRPTLSSVPSLVNYTSSFFVGTPDAGSIATVVLMRAGSFTHGIDMEQRRVVLTFSQTSGGLTVNAPANSNLAPPGHYMLFLLNATGVPSVSKFVRLPAPYEDTVPPSAPGLLTAQGGIGTAALTWGASTDANGVALYNVHRSTSSGFTPSAANRIAQVAGTTFGDSGLAGGLYYYVVTAQDANANVSAPSNQATASVAADVAPPSVSLTAPAAGATLSETVTVSANASDDAGVAGVQFLLDGAPLMAEDTSAPYSIQWNTLATANGPHQLSARARDTGGNQTTSSTTAVTLSNSATAGSVGAYAFNEASGTAVVDSSGNGNNGSYAGATRVAGKYGNGLQFDGATSMVSVANSATLNLTTAVSLMAWVKPTTLQGWSIVAMKERPGNETWTLYANDGQNRPRAYVLIGGVNYNIVGTSQLPLNTWSHVAMTYDGTVVRLFVNGVQVGSQNATGALTTSTSPFRIGGNTIWGEYFNGTIDEVRVFNRGLSAAEVGQVMNTPVLP